MRGVNPGEVWMIDFGMAAKVRPALLLIGEPAAGRTRPSNRSASHHIAAQQPMGTGHSQAVPKTRRVSPATSPDHFYSQARATAWSFD